jgi:hypothetical protein
MAPIQRAKVVMIASSLGVWHQLRGRDQTVSCQCKTKQRQSDGHTPGNRAGQNGDKKRNGKPSSWLLPIRIAAFLSLNPGAASQLAPAGTEKQRMTLKLNFRINIT